MGVSRREPCIKRQLDRTSFTATRSPVESSPTFATNATSLTRRSWRACPSMSVSVQFLTNGGVTPAIMCTRWSIATTLCFARTIPFARFSSAVASWACGGSTASASGVFSGADTAIESGENSRPSWNSWSMAGYRAKVPHPVALLGDATRIGLCDQSVDVALCVAVSHHLTALHSGQSLYPATTSHPAGLCLTRHQRSFTQFTPPAFPSV